ncbi:hypothetical protein CPB83DRAFT_891537 [Crepidotus variabilis]|uniref:DUF6534 domain-containing protein n=1 Tax=Crepidotus variabilis TaxID=179855 RepID=A0A9P6EMM1_9AGAR|nr:hypothetical protein CPB83DRAFT_891537 [Crepidotus variabilis]
MGYLAYSYMVTRVGVDDGVQLIVRTVIGAATFTVQMYLIYRIWRLKFYKWLVVIDGFLSVAQLVVVIIFTVKAVPISSYEELRNLKWLAVTANILSIASDICIALSQISVLHRAGAFEYSRSKQVTQRIVLFTINNGLLTALCALGSMLSIILYPTTLVYIAFFFCTARVYGNTMMLSLNARGYFQGHPDDAVNVSDVSSLGNVNELSTPSGVTSESSRTSGNLATSSIEFAVEESSSSESCKSLPV